MSKSGEATKNPITQGVNFFRESWAELKKIHTPTRKDTIRATGAVLLMLVFISTLLGIADSLFGWVMTKVLG